MYRGPSLAHVFNLEDQVPRLLHRLAEEGGSQMTTNVRYHTPVGHHQFREHYIPGTLLASIHQKLVVVVPTAHGLAYESGTETDVEYAPYVENGTGLWGPARAKYEIRPKNPDGWLRFHDASGNVIFAKRVMHPGSPGSHMFARGTAKTEEEFHNWAREIVRDWENEIELLMRLRAQEKVLVS